MAQVSKESATLCVRKACFIKETNTGAIWVKQSAVIGNDFRSLRCKVVSPVVGIFRLREDRRTPIRITRLAAD